MRLAHRLPALLLLPLLALNMPLRAGAVDSGHGFESLEHERHRLDVEDWTRDLQDRLAADPRAMATSLRLLLRLLAEMREPGAGSTLDLQADFELAFAAAREQQDLPALHLLRAATTCHPQLGERSLAVQSWLQAVDGDNLSVSLMALRSCGSGRDPQADQAALQRAARSSHYRSYRGEIAAGLAVVQAEVPVPAALLESLAKPVVLSADEFHTLNAAGLMFLLDVGPGSGGDLRSLCVPAADLRLEGCRHSARLLADSPWLIDRLPALRLLQTLGENATERAAAAQERRRLQWWMQVHAELAMQAWDAPDDDPAAAQRARGELQRTIDNLRSGRGEIALLRDQLRQAGLPLEPPEDWDQPH